MWTISTAQPAGSTDSGLPRSSSATSSDRIGRSRLAGANRLSSTAAGTAAAREGSTSRRSAASTSRRRASSVRSSSSKPVLAGALLMTRPGHLNPLDATTTGRGFEDRLASPMDYRDAGVDITAADAAKGRIKALARATFNPQVLTEIGSFGGMFRPDLSRYREPVLVASTDGVGTKIKVAIAAGIHDTVGYDLVAHCVNDILVQGALPLFFLDYIALGKLDPLKVEQIVSGFSRACAEFSCPLIGGETAEMPGTYAEDDYDLAGFIVGVVERERALPRGVAAGDVLVGLPSLGLHTNGYSLARKVLFDTLGHRRADRAAGARHERGPRPAGAAPQLPRRARAAARARQDPGARSRDGWRLPRQHPARACRRGSAPACAAAPGRCRRCSG